MSPDAIRGLVLISFPASPPHVDGQVPVPINEDDDNRNDLGADLVLTYGPHAQEQSDNTSSGAEGSRTGGSGQVRIILIS